MEILYKQFIREKQYLHNVSRCTVDGYHWAWKAFEPTLAGRSCVARRQSYCSASKNCVSVVWVP